jgi:hypothetical protein
MTDLIQVDLRTTLDFLLRTIPSSSAFTDFKDLDNKMTRLVGGGSNVQNISNQLTLFFNQDYIRALKNQSLDHIMKTNNLSLIHDMSSKDIAECFFTKRKGKLCMESFQDNPFCIHVLSEIEDEYFVEYLNAVIRKVYYSCGALFKKTDYSNLNLSTLLRLGLNGHNFFKSGDWRILFIAMKKDNPIEYKKYIALIDKKDYSNLKKNRLIRELIPKAITKDTILEYICLSFLCELVFRHTPSHRLKDSLMLEHIFFLMGFNS